MYLLCSEQYLHLTRGKRVGCQTEHMSNTSDPFSQLIPFSLNFPLLFVAHSQFHMNNFSLLSDKCPPGWTLVDTTCFLYVPAPMTFTEARQFCQVGREYAVI